jgi:hypothetical protein
LRPLYVWRWCLNSSIQFFNQHRWTRVSETSQPLPRRPRRNQTQISTHQLNRMRADFSALSKYLGGSILYLFLIFFYFFFPGIGLWKWLANVAQAEAPSSQRYWNEVKWIGELRWEKRNVFTRPSTKSNCRLYATRGGGRHCQVIPGITRTSKIEEGFILILYVF